MSQSIVVFPWGRSLLSQISLIKNAVKKTTAIFGSGCVYQIANIKSLFMGKGKLSLSEVNQWQPLQPAKTGKHILGSGVWGLSLRAGRHIHRTQPADCYSVCNGDNRMVEGI